VKNNNSEKFKEKEKDTFNETYNISKNVSSDFIFPDSIEVLFLQAMMTEPIHNTLNTKFLEI
jgi:hypothetical protein